MDDIRQLDGSHCAPARPVPGRKEAEGVAGWSPDGAGTRMKGTSQTGRVTPSGWPLFRQSGYPDRGPRPTAPYWWARRDPGPGSRLRLTLYWSAPAATTWTCPSARRPGDHIRHQALFRSRGRPGKFLHGVPLPYPVRLRLSPSQPPDPGDSRCCSDDRGRQIGPSSCLALLLNDPQRCVQGPALLVRLHSERQIGVCEGVPGVDGLHDRRPDLSQ